jgi:hypothetical protein
MTNSYFEEDVDDATVAKQAHQGEQKEENGRTVSNQGMLQL